jgi:arylsulfatase A-like enzyme
MRRIPAPREPSAWPGKIKAGSVSNEIVSHLDLLPTIVAAGGDSQIKGKLLGEGPAPGLLLFLRRRRAGGQASMGDKTCYVNRRGRLLAWSPRRRSEPTRPEYPIRK